MTKRNFGKSIRTQTNNRTKLLDDVPVLCYKHNTYNQRQGVDENMGKEPNFDLGGKPLKVDSGFALDPRIVRLVKALARHSAEEDFNALIEK